MTIARRLPGGTRQGNSLTAPGQHARIIGHQHGPAVRRKGRLDAFVPFRDHAGFIVRGKEPAQRAEQVRITIFGQVAKRPPRQVNGNIARVTRLIGHRAPMETTQDDLPAEPRSEFAETSPSKDRITVN